MVYWRTINRRNFSAAKVALTIAGFLLYAVAFRLLFPRMGGSVAALSLLPVVVGSWLLGLGGGILLAVLSIFLSAVLLNLEGEAGWDFMLGRAGSAGAFAVLFAGVAAGYVRTLYHRHTEETEALRQADVEQTLQLQSNAIPRNNTEKHYIRKDGPGFWANLTERAIHGERERTQYYLGMAEDIDERKRDEEALQRRDRMMEALAFSAEQLLRNPNWQEALRAVLQRLGDASGASRARVMKNVAESGEQSGVHYWAEWTAEGVASTAEIAHRLTPERARELFQPIEKQLAEGRMICGQREQFPEPLRSVLSELDVHNAALVPIFVDEAWWGQLGFDDCRGEFSFGRIEQEVFAIAASLLGAAIGREQAEHRLRKQNRELLVLNRVIAATSSKVEPRVVLETACRELAQALNVSQAGAALVNAGATRLEVVAEYMTEDGPSAIGELIPIADNVATQTVMREKRALVVGDAQSDPAMAPIHELMRQRNIASMMLLPLQVNGEVVGTLGLDSATHREFSEEELQLATTAAAALGQVLERAQLHTATETQARQMQQVVDSVPVGLLLLDGDRRVLLANGLARAYLEAVGAYDEDGRLQAFGGVALGALLEAPEQGRHFHEVKVEEAEQQVFEVRAAAIEGAGWALVLHDVTAERDQATRLQAQERLAAVGQLSAGIAHDFNNILGVIVIYSQMLQHQVLSPPAARRLQIIHEQAQRASQLVQQILDFSRKAVMRREPLDLLAFMQAHVTLLRRTLPETIAIGLAHEAGSYVVEADATRLQQVVMNLAVNARDAMPEGGRLHFALSRLGRSEAPPLPEMGPSDRICIAVSDCGSGIEPQQLEHIFEPFFTTKAPGQGSGLGLAQVYGIVRQHAGFIDVESAVGEGTTFFIYLPALEMELCREESPVEVATMNTEQTILVVEDNEIIRDAVVEILKALDYKVVAAEDGEKAVATYQAHGSAIGLVISDMVMPRMGGKALYHALRAHNPGVRMVLTSGYPLDDQNRTFVEESGSVWVRKPFTQEMLVGAIERVLGHEGAAE